MDHITVLLVLSSFPSVSGFLPGGGGTQAISAFQEPWLAGWQVQVRECLRKHVEIQSLMKKIKMFTFTRKTIASSKYGFATQVWLKSILHFVLLKHLTKLT